MLRSIGISSCVLTTEVDGHEGGQAHGHGYHAEKNGVTFDESMKN